MELSSLQFYLGIALIAITYPSYLLAVYLVKEHQSAAPGEINPDGTIAEDNGKTNENTNNGNPARPSINAKKDSTQRNREDSVEKRDNNRWQCACEGGGIFLPASMMKSLCGPSAAMRLGAGGCYHKQM
jgi:hypothetical protein